MKGSRWRSRLIAVTVALGGVLLAEAVSASLTSPLMQGAMVDQPSTALTLLLKDAPADGAGQTERQQHSNETPLLDVEGRLEASDQPPGSDSLYAIHTFEGYAGQMVAITLESIEFDTVLMLQDAAGIEVASNDDIDIEAYNYNSFMVVVLPVAGTYRIRVSAYDNTRLGNYRLIAVQTASETATPNLSEAALTHVEANQRLELGIQANRTGQYAEAIRFWQEALALYRTIGDRYGEANSLGSMGNAYESLGRYGEAVELHQQALAIEREIGSRAGETDTLNNLGVVYYALGQYQRAIELHQQALDIIDETRARLPVRMRQAEANALGNLGSVYYALGQYRQAIEAYQQALVITRDVEIRKALPVQSRRVEASILGNLGSVYDSLGEYQRAVDFQQQFLVIARELGDRQGEANALGNLGNAAHSLGRYEQAIDFHQQSLAIDREIGNRQGEAVSLGNLGYVYSFLKQYQQAIDFYQQQLTIAREIRDRQGEAKALNNLGFMLILTERFAEAETTLTQALGVYESLRSDLSDAQRIAIADTQAHTYANLELALFFQDKHAEALAITERGRAQAFALQLASRQSNGATETPMTSPSIADIQRIARQQNITIVEYSLIYDLALYIWVVQPSGDIQFRSVSFSDSDNTLVGDNPIATLDGPVYRSDSGPSELDALVADSRAGIGIVGDIPSERLKNLHQVLIDPIADLLPTDPEANVIFVPQGNLFLVPFAALQDTDGTYLIEKHTVLTAPSIQVLGLAEREQRQARSFLTGRDALVVGNPVMPEVVIPHENGLQTIQLAPLPGTETEALAIGAFLNISPLIGYQATEAQVKQQLPNASLIHLATHGLLEYGDPQTSGVLDIPGALALTPGDGEDGLLTAAEILEMDLQAELAVLSACDTGRGRITGDGVVGLSRSLITAGVPSVIVSLWAVPDAPTAALMTEFYSQLQQGQTKAQALRQAMLLTMENHPEPLNWAAFTLLGAAE